MVNSGRSLLMPLVAGTSAWAGGRRAGAPRAVSGPHFCAPSKDGFGSGRWWRLAVRWASGLRGCAGLGEVFSGGGGGHRYNLEF